MGDPRVLEFRTALAEVDLGLRAPKGAHERYRLSLTPYLECMAEHTPAEPPFVRREMMRALFQTGLPLAPILFAYRATIAEAEFVEAHPPVVAEPVDEQERLARMPYGLYLKTPHWYAIRKDALRRAEGRCVICGTDQGLQVHHRDYTRKGAERPADVTVLCGSCHGHHHAQGKAA